MLILLDAATALTVMVGLFSDGPCTKWSKFGPCLPACGLKGVRTVVKECMYDSRERVKEVTFYGCVMSCSVTLETTTTNENGKM